VDIPFYVFSPITINTLLLFISTFSTHQVKCKLTLPNLDWWWHANCLFEDRYFVHGGQAFQCFFKEGAEREKIQYDHLYQDGTTVVDSATSFT